MSFANDLLSSAIKCEDFSATVSSTGGLNKEPFKQKYYAFLSATTPC